MTLPSIQLPSLITPSSISSRNGKQFGVLRLAVDLLAQTEELRRRNPNNPHIEVMLQYYRKHPRSMITRIENKLMLIALYLL